MEGNWQVAEGTGWISIPEFGEIAPRRDNVDGGRQFFTAKVAGDEYAKVSGDTISGGDEIWGFEFDQPFWLADRKGRCVEVTISLLVGGRYAVKHRAAKWPDRAISGGW